jgi:exopolysaccharide production protein ExoZ
MDAGIGKREHIVGLDLVRLAAAVSVMVYHLGYKTQALAADADRQRLGVPAHLPGWWAFSWWGWVGVQVFFVLSGVVIAGSARDASLGAFVRGRARRLLPALWICVLLSAAISLTLHWRAPAAVAVLAAKTAVLWPAGPWLIDPVWSLPVEVVFYGLIAGLIVTGRIGSIRNLAAVLAFASLAFWTGIATGALSNWPFSALLLVQHGGYFALGIVFADWTRRRPRPLDWLTVAACVAAARIQIASACLAEQPGYGLGGQGGAVFLLWLAGAALIGLSWRLNPLFSRLPPAALSAIRTAGLMTYPLYLIHACVGVAVLGVLPRASGWSLLAACVACIAVALGIILYAEPPLRAALDRTLDAARARPRRRPSLGTAPAASEAPS